DFLQFNMPAGFAFTGTITSDNPSGNSWAVKGRAAKGANSVTTSYSYTATPTSSADGSSETIFGTWQTLYLSGAASYIRGAQNQITLNVTQSTDGDASTGLV